MFPSVIALGAGLARDFAQIVSEPILDITRLVFHNLGISSIL
jgi:hypothetical protein